MDFIIAFCAADERISDFRHPVATGKKIEKRAMISVNSRRKGLIVSITRFVQFGPVPAKLKKLYEDNVLRRQRDHGRNETGPAGLGSLPSRSRRLRREGLSEEYKLHHQGGAIGYFGRDYKATAATKELVRENQGFAWNPSITGTKSEDTMIATSAGADHHLRAGRIPHITP